MTLEVLENEMKEALRAGNKTRRSVLSEMVGAVQKASTAGKQRVEITEKLVDETLQKVQKTYQEMVDTCPIERTELLTQYKEQLEIVKEFAPQLITDEEAIRVIIATVLDGSGITSEKKNRGKMMKLLAPAVKGKVDMAVLNKVLENSLK